MDHIVLTMFLRDTKPNLFFLILHIFLHCQPHIFTKVRNESYCYQSKLTHLYLVKMVFLAFIYFSYRLFYRSNIMIPKKKNMWADNEKHHVKSLSGNRLVQF